MEQGAQVPAVATSIPVPAPISVDTSTASTHHGPRKSLPVTPSRLKAPRPSALPTPQQSSSTSDLPTLGTGNSGNGNSSNGVTSKSTLPLPGNELRRTISIGSFPQPPATISRPGTSASMTSPSSPNKQRSSKESITAVKVRKLPRMSTASTLSSKSDLTSSATDGKSVPSSSSNRASDGHSSGASPPQSRSSSANGSYSTTATTIDDGEEERGRPKETAEVAANSKSSANKKDTKGNVIVSVRVRPDNNGQDNTPRDGEWMVSGREALITYRGKESGDYQYDNVFGTYEDNAKVYDSAAKRLVRRVMEGYHGTVFAYGMTGTGKTFSMQGTMSSPGVIPLAITDIFSYIRETPQREFLLRVSYLEIYNEKIHDLLAASSNGGINAPQEEIKLREDRHRGVYATPLKEEIVQSPTQLLRVIHRGDMARRTGSTQFNSRSSRSHAVVQIVVESRERNAPGAKQENSRVAMLPTGVRVSTLSLIDLAGSERAAEDKERRAEGAHINKSLLTLGTVIAKLSGNRDKNGNIIDKDGKHLPYRDSKLTRLLQPALSGNSLISILCTIQIGSQGTSAVGNTHTYETLNTLKFAARAKNNIVSHAKRANEEMGSGVNAGLLERYRNEIANLRAQLETQQKNAAKKSEERSEPATENNAKNDGQKDENPDATDQDIDKDAERRHEEQMLEMQLARTALKERIEHLNRLILCSKSTGVNAAPSSSTGLQSRLSTATNGDIGARSVRSSASQSTLGAMGPSVVRHPSYASLGGIQMTQSPTMGFSAIEDEDAIDDYGDGRATLQAQNRALQADLQDKNRYIATLEKRLLQARRSSHSRTSIGFSKANMDDGDTKQRLEERDAQIADLQRTVTALRSAMRQRSIADLTPDLAAGEFKTKSEHDDARSVRDSVRGSFRPSSRSSVRDGVRENLRAARANTSLHRPRGSVASTGTHVSPVTLLLPEKNQESKRKSVDEMSRMLDEMIQDKVESGHLIKGRTGSVRLPPRTTSSRRNSRRNSTSTLSTGLPPLTTAIMEQGERSSIADPSSAV